VSLENGVQIYGEILELWLLGGKNILFAHRNAGLDASRFAQDYLNLGCARQLMQASLRSLAQDLDNLGCARQSMQASLRSLAQDLDNLGCARQSMQASLRSLAQDLAISAKFTNFDPENNNTNTNTSQ